MEDSIRETEAVNISNLPTDIIRLIIPMVGFRWMDHMESLRLISLSWNSMVLEYQSYRRNYPSLENVRLSGSTRRNTVTVEVEMLPKYEEHFKCHFQGWKREIIAHWLWDDKIKYSYTYPKADIHKISPIFSRCSSIKNLNFCSIDPNMWKYIQNIINDVLVKDLTIFQNNFNMFMRGQIFRFAKLHKIKRIGMNVAQFQHENLHNFFFDVTKRGCVLEIKELYSMNDLRPFGHSKEFWENMAQEMSNASYSVQVMEELHFELKISPR